MCLNKHTIVDSLWQAIKFGAIVKICGKKLTQARRMLVVNNKRRFLISVGGRKHITPTPVNIHY